MKLSFGTIVVLAVVCLIEFAAAPETQVPQPASTCDQPMRAAAIVYAVPPATPPEAQRLGINGTVHVDVKLDDQGRVLGVDIASSDNAVLNESSLMAAIRTRYRAKVENCVGVPSTYRFIVTYSSR